MLHHVLAQDYERVLWLYSQGKRCLRCDYLGPRTDAGTAASASLCFVGGRDERETRQGHTTQGERERERERDSPSAGGWPPGPRGFLLPQPLKKKKKKRQRKRKRKMGREGDRGGATERERERGVGRHAKPTTCRVDNCWPPGPWRFRAGRILRKHGPFMRNP